MAADDGIMPLQPGAVVEVRNQFDGAWCPGFQIDQASPDGYIVRRCRDGAVLPKTFASGLVRAPVESV
jgi:hypothetical protein